MSGDKYRNAEHGIALQVIMGETFRELQSAFTEDNTATTTAFMIERLLPETTMSKDHPMRLQLEEIIGVLCIVEMVYS